MTLWKCQTQAACHLLQNSRRGSGGGMGIITGAQQGAGHTHSPGLAQWNSSQGSTVCGCQSLSPIQLFLTPWTVPRQALPLSMGFSRQNTGVCCHAFLQRIFLTQGSTELPTSAAQSNRHREQQLHTIVEWLSLPTLRNLQVLKTGTIQKQCHLQQHGQTQRLSY